MKTANEFAALLEIRQSHPKTETWVKSRLMKLSLGTACRRCGGCGHYSFNSMHGSVCYGCGGSGYTIGKLTDSLYAQAESKVQDGENARIIKENRERANAAKAPEMVMQTWQAASEANPYDWRKAADWHRAPTPENALHHKASEFNAVMCDEHTAVARMHGEWKLLAVFNPRLTMEQNEENRKAIPAKASELMARAQVAVARIQAVKEEVAAWRATLTDDEKAILKK